MSDFYTRLISEKDELVSRLYRLTNYLYSESFYSLSTENRDLLLLQHEKMLDYLRVLEYRIALNA